MLNCVKKVVSGEKQGNNTTIKRSYVRIGKTVPFGNCLVKGLFVTEEYRRLISKS